MAASYPDARLVSSEEDEESSSLPEELSALTGFMIT
jgi:hypothetical protein